MTIWQKSVFSELLKTESYRINRKNVIIPIPIQLLFQRKLLTIKLYTFTNRFVCLHDC